MSKKILVVGGVAGGATFVARMRRLQEDAEIILFERGEYISFANCGLPYHIGGIIPQRDQLLVADKEAIKKKYNVDIRTGQEVLSIDKNNKLVRVKKLDEDKVYEESYDKLLIATGSSPIIPPIKGVEAENVLKLWTIPDMDKIINYIKNKSPKKAFVVGGGFIGLEVVENLKELGLEVTVADKSPYVLSVLDRDMALLVEEELRNKGVRVITGQDLKEIKHSKSSSELIFDNGSTYEADLIIMAIGIKPNSELAKTAELEINQRGGICVDEHLKTSNDDIYAVGDVIEQFDFITGQRRMLPLAGPANKQARIVADNISGLKSKYGGFIGTSVAKIFDMTMASTGANEKDLIARGLKHREDYYISVIHSNSNASYYPGATPIILKLIYAPSGEILGAQAVGYDGVDKRIDVIATVIRLKGTIYDLTELELGYAPPYSSAKDPVNMIGFVAENQLKGIANGVLVDEYLKEPDQYVILDIREDMELLSGKFKDSIHIPLSVLRENLDKLDKKTKYIAICAIGLRGYIATRILMQNGFLDASYMIGGMRTYKLLSGLVNNESCNPMADECVSDIESKNPKSIDLNLCGLSCPGPIIKLSEEFEKVDKGTQVNVLASDPGFARDIESWCENTGNVLHKVSQSKGRVEAIISKGELDTNKNNSISNPEKTMIVFSGDLDKAIASFIIATGAAAMGDKVNMFFTFWGLNVLRKAEKIDVKKDTISKMFGKMMPRGSKKLGLSKMNMGGMGAKMIRGVMKKQNIESLEDLILQAQKSGVKFIACQMSMDVMGIDISELIDGVQVGGVATMLNDSNHSNMNLFI